jgi:hypothetical protein
MWMRFGPGHGVSGGARKWEQRNGNDSDDLPTRTRDGEASRNHAAHGALCTLNCALCTVRLYWARFADHDLRSRGRDVLRTKSLRNERRRRGGPTSQHSKGDHLPLRGVSDLRHKAWRHAKVSSIEPQASPIEPQTSPIDPQEKSTIGYSYSTTTIDHTPLKARSVGFLAGPFPPTHDLVQHEALPVDLHADPLDLAVHLRILDFQANHVPLHRPVVERFSDGVVVEVATVCQRGSRSRLRDFLESTILDDSHTQNEENRPQDKENRQSSIPTPAPREIPLDARFSILGSGPRTGDAV